MEYCAYGSIDSYLKKGNRLKEEELGEIVSCCLLGLQCLHERDIVYGVRDSDHSLNCRTSHQRTCSFQRMGQ